MANALYPLWKQALMTEAAVNKSLDQVAANGVYVSLVTIASGYIYSPAHQFYTSITNVQGTPTIISGTTVVGSIFNGGSVVFTAVSGTAIGAVVLTRQNTGANSTWRLVSYEDTNFVGFPATPNGGNLVLYWSASGIFQLGSS